MHAREGRRVPARGKAPRRVVAVRVGRRPRDRVDVGRVMDSLELGAGRLARP